MHTNKHTNTGRRRPPLSPPAPLAQYSIPRLKPSVEMWAQVRAAARAQLAERVKAVMSDAYFALEARCAVPGGGPYAASQVPHPGGGGPPPRAPVRVAPFRSASPQCPPHPHPHPPRTLTPTPTHM